MPSLIKLSTLLLLITLLSSLLLTASARKPLLSPRSAKAAKAAAVVDTPPVPATPVVKRSTAKLQPRAPQASSKMGRRKLKKALADRAAAEKKDYSNFLCPGGSKACPNPSTKKDKSGVERPVGPEEMGKMLQSLPDWFKVGFECVEFENELNSCGGCVTLGTGQDCSAIPFSRRSGCESSSCIIYQCRDGYTVSSDKKSCVSRLDASSTSSTGNNAESGSGSGRAASATEAYGLEEEDSQIAFS